MVKIPWTEREADLLKQMVNAGKTMPEIRTVLKDRSSDSIKAKAQSMGLRVEFFREAEIDMEAFKRLMAGR